MSFDAIMTQLQTLRDAGLSDSPSYQRLARMALDCAPDELIGSLMDRAVKCGYAPPPSGVDANGQKVWRMEAVAQWLGIPDHQIEQSIQDFEEEIGPFQRIDPATISRIH